MARAPRPYQYCPLCAESLDHRQVGDRVRPVCEPCSFVHYKNPSPGVAVIAFREGEIVMIRTGQKGYLHGQWCIPCGHLEYDEHVREAAAREFEEETGLRVELEEVYHVDSNHFEPWGHNSVGIWFEGHIVGGTMQAGDDALEVETFDLTDLPDRIAYKSDMRVLRKLCRERGLPVPEFGVEL